MRRLCKSKRATTMGAAIQAVFAIIILGLTIFVMFQKFEDFPQINEVADRLNQLETQSNSFEVTQQALLSFKFADFEEAYLSNREELSLEIDEIKCVRSEIIIFSTKCNGLLKESLVTKVNTFLVEDDDLADGLVVVDDSKINGANIVYSYDIFSYSAIQSFQFKEPRFRKVLFIFGTEDEVFAEKNNKLFYGLPFPDIPFAYRYIDYFQAKTTVGENMTFLLNLDSQTPNIIRTVQGYLIEKKSSFANSNDWKNHLFAIDEDTGLAAKTERAKAYEAETIQLLKKKHPLLERDFKVNLTEDSFEISFETEMVVIELMY